VSGSLAVAASTRSDTLAPFSTHGPWVQVSAPGDEIISTVPGGAYATWSGTSMAAPSAAGVAALLRAREPALGAAAVVERLVTSAQPLCSDGPPRLDAAHVLGRPAAEPRLCSQVHLPSVRTQR
jgi:subtilisin family serine protease